MIYDILNDCMFQQNYLNATHIYQGYVGGYEAIIKYVESKKKRRLRNGDQCLYIINSTFWWSDGVDYSEVNEDTTKSL